MTEQEQASEIISLAINVIKAGQYPGEMAEAVAAVKSFLQSMLDKVGESEKAPE